MQVQLLTHIDDLELARSGSDDASIDVSDYKNLVA